MYTSNRTKNYQLNSYNFTLKKLRLTRSSFFARQFPAQNAQRYTSFPFKTSQRKFPKSICKIRLNRALLTTKTYPLQAQRRRRSPAPTKGPAGRFIKGRAGKNDADSLHSCRRSIPIRSEACRGPGAARAGGRSPRRRRRLEPEKGVDRRRRAITAERQFQRYYARPRGRNSRRAGPWRKNRGGD